MIVVLNTPACNPDDLAERVRDVARQIQCGRTIGWFDDGGFWHSEGLD